MGFGQCIFGSALSHTHRSDPLEKKEKKKRGHFGQIRLWTSFESSPVSVKKFESFNVKYFQSLKVKNADHVTKLVILLNRNTMVAKR